MRHAILYLLADFEVDFDPLTMARLQGRFSTKEADAFSLNFARENRCTLGKISATNTNKEPN